MQQLLPNCSFVDVHYQYLEVTHEYSKCGCSLYDYSKYDEMVEITFLILFLCSIKSTIKIIVLLL